MIDNSNCIIQLIISVLIFIFLTMVSLPAFNYFSNLLSSIGIYHENEKFWVRIAYLYRAYLIISIPIIFAIITLLTTSGLITNLFDAIILAIGSYVLFPISSRVFSLAKSPKPYICTVTDWKKTHTNDERITAHKREILCDRRERYLSSYFSIILIAWIIYIVIFPVYIFLNGTEKLYETYEGISQVTFNSGFLLLIMFFSLPLLYTFIGELILKITGIEEHLTIKR